MESLLPFWNEILRGLHDRGIRLDGKHHAPPTYASNFMRGVGDKGQWQVTYTAGSFSSSQLSAPSSALNTTSRNKVRQWVYAQYSVEGGVTMNGRRLKQAEETRSAQEKWAAKEDERTQSAREAWEAKEAERLRTPQEAAQAHEHWGDF